jgi:general secretion pathway protein N
MRAARASLFISIAAVFACVFACAGGPSGATAQVQLAALDSAAPPGLGDIEQFPIAPRQPISPQPVVAQPAAAQPKTGNPLWAVPLRTLSATRERPIFSPSRRPPPTAVAVVPAEPAPQAPRPVVPERPALALVGTIVGEGESIAIFYNPATKATIRLRLGETDEMGWKLVAVDARTTLLEKGRQSVTLALPAPGDAPGGLPAQPRGADPDL